MGGQRGLCDAQSRDRERGGRKQTETPQMGGGCDASPGARSARPPSVSSCMFNGRTAASKAVGPGSTPGRGTQQAASTRNNEHLGTDRQPVVFFVPPQGTGRGTRLRAKDGWQGLTTPRHNTPQEGGLPYLRLSVRGLDYSDGQTGPPPHQGAGPAAQERIL